MVNEILFSCWLVLALRNTCYAVLAPLLNSGIVFIVCWSSLSLLSPVRVWGQALQPSAAVASLWGCLLVSQSLKEDSKFLHHQCLYTFPYIISLSFSVFFIFLVTWVSLLIIVSTKTHRILEIIRYLLLALAGVAQRIECWPVNLRVAGSISSQGTNLGSGPGPQLGTCERQPINESLTHWWFPLFLPPVHSLKK